MGNVTAYSYDPNNQLIRKTDANGQVTQYASDALGRLISVTDALGHTTIFSYEAIGNMVVLKDANGHTTQFEYDRHQRLIKQILPMLQEDNYSYDAAGNLLGYDGGSRLTRVEIPDVGSIGFGGFRWLRPTTVTLPEGTSREFDYDALMRVNAITVSNPDGNEVLNYTYAHDPIGSITTKNTEHGSYDYTYDANYRLIQAHKPGSSDEAFTYDPEKQLL